MSSKINLSSIVVDHFATLRNEASGRASALDIGTFFVLPLVFGLTSYWQAWVFSDSTINLIVTCMAIFAGLMINVLGRRLIIAQPDAHRDEL
jgi:hypothetical protein